MAPTATVKYATCDLQFIESTAAGLANIIILRKEPVGKVLTRITGAGVCNIDYTRTISLILQYMICVLRRTNSQLYSRVKDEIVDRAVSTYINYWEETLYGPPHRDHDDDDSYLSPDTIDPLAVAAYIGDLHTLGYLSPKLLTICLAYLVNNFKRTFHLRCIELTLERANSYPVPRLEPLYVLECLSTIRKRSYQLFGKEISTEEDSLTHLLYRLMFKTRTTTIHWEREDPRLCQTSAEITKLCLVPNHGNNVDDHPMSTQSSASNSLLGSAKRSSYKPRTFEELDLIWELCDAIYASPAPEDLPPPIDS